jgi:uncharacterized protein (DUF433 family)
MPSPALCGKNSAVNAQNPPRIVVDPSTCGGRPTVRGTHFAVADILRLLEDGDTDETLVADFPPLTVADVRACRAYAAATGLAATRGDWIDRFAGTFDEDFARAALDRPGPECFEAAYKSCAVCGTYRGTMTHPGHPKIVSDPEICGGKPTVAGTRVRVTDVLAMLAEGVGEAEILADFPYLTLEDVRACLAFAASVTGGERIPPGYYTRETLPPLSPGAAAIIASVDAAASAESAKAPEDGEGLRLGDTPFTPLSVNDRPLRGYDPDR